MELKQYFSIIWRRKWIIAATLAVALIAIAVVHSQTTPVYSASTTVRVAISVVGVQYPTSYSYNDQLLNTYVQIAASRPVLDGLAQKLKMSKPPAIRAEVIPNTELIRITAESTNPKLAAQAANTLAEILIGQSQELYAGGARASSEILAGQMERAQGEVDVLREDYQRLVAQATPQPEQINVAGQLLQEKQRTYEDLQRQYDEAQLREAIGASMITVTEAAIVPTTPSEPRMDLNYLIGGAFGLLAGLILAFVFENTDSRLHDTRAIESAAHTHTLAKFPHTAKQHLLLSGNGASPLSESVRYLAAQIQWMEREAPRKVLLVTGAEPGQGATTAAANLADALAERGRKVVLVDCNLRHPKLHELFHLPNEKGLTDVLDGKLDLKQALQKAPDGHLSLLTSGPITGATLHVLDAARVDSLIASLRAQFDYILLDTPALTVADGASFAPIADGMILVARRSHVQRAAVESAGEYLSKFEGKFLGLVVNEAEGRPDWSYA